MRRGKIKHTSDETGLGSERYGGMKRGHFFYACFLLTVVLNVSLPRRENSFIYHKLQRRRGSVVVIA